MGEKRKVKVDMSELSAAFELNFAEINTYLDLETGQVMSVDDETRHTLEELYDEIYDEQGNRTISLKDHLAERDDLHDWMKEFLLQADIVEQA